MKRIITLLVRSVIVACAAASFATAAVAAPSFEDAGNVFARGEHPALTAIGGFAAGQERLAGEFNAICGDTFCAGDFGNLQALSLACSVEAQAQQVGQCIWVFAGSYAFVDRATGKVSMNKQVFECDLGFKGTAADLSAFLVAAAEGGASGTDGLRQVKIPGGGRTLMDVLLHCL